MCCHVTRRCRGSQPTLEDPASAGEDCTVINAMRIIAVPKLGINAVHDGEL